MNCSEIEKYLSEYIDGELDPTIQSRMESHLKSCNQCREKLDALKFTVNNLTQMPKVQAPADFLHRLHERLEKESPIKRLIKGLFIPFGIKIPIELATAAALGVLIFFIVLPIHRQQLPMQGLNKEAVLDKGIEVRKEKTRLKESDRQMAAKPPVMQSQATVKKDQEAPSPVGVLGKKDELAIEKQTVQVKEQVIAQAQVAESEAMKAKEEPEPVPIVSSEKKQGYDLLENRPVKSLEQASPQPSTKMADAEVPKENEAPAPIIISLVIPGEKKFHAASKLAREKQTLDETAASNEYAAKRKSDTMTDTGLPAPEKTEQDNKPTSLPAAPASAISVEQKIFALINQFQGKVINTQTNDSGQTNSIAIEIPASAYTQFTDRLKAFVEFTSALPEVPAQKDQPISLTIRLITQP